MRSHRFPRAVALVAAAAALLVPTNLLAAQPVDAATNTIVSLTFDDGQASHYSTLSMMRAHGMQGTYYITSGLVGSSFYYMTWPEIHDLADGGQEIGGHTLNHTDLSSVSLSAAQREVCDDRANLLDQGFSPVTSFAYPYAGANATAEQAVQSCGYTSGRGVGGIVSGTQCGGCPYAETIPPGDAFRLSAPKSADSTTSLALLQSYVTQAESHGGGWVILSFHGICSDGCTGGDSFSPTIFMAFLDWLQPRAASGTVVRTVGSVMGASSTPSPPPAASSVTSNGCNG